MSEQVNWEGHAGGLVDTAGEYRVIECETCGFKHIVPIPTPDELDEAYRGDYYSKEKPLYLNRTQEDLDWWETVYSDRYDALEDLLAPDRRRLLEVGSGPGYFLAHGARRGWDVIGVEPSRQAAEHSRKMGLNVVEEFLTEDLRDQLGRFDAIHASQVFEHLPDPRGMLALVRRMLEPGGVLCLSVPNDYNPLQTVLRQTRGFTPWWVAPPHHVNYFDFTSFSRLLESEGYAIVGTESTFPMEMFLLMGDNYVGDDEMGRECHRRRKMLELSLAEGGCNELKRDIFRALAALGIGREVVVYASR